MNGLTTRFDWKGFWGQTPLVLRLRLLVDIGAITCTRIVQDFRKWTNLHSFLEWDDGVSRAGVRWWVGNPLSQWQQHQSSTITNLWDTFVPPLSCLQKAEQAVKIGMCQRKCGLQYYSCIHNHVAIPYQKRPQILIITDVQAHSMITVHYALIINLSYSAHKTLLFKLSCINK